MTKLPYPLQVAIDKVRHELDELERGRDLSMCLTKLDELELWAERAVDLAERVSTRDERARERNEGSA